MSSMSNGLQNCAYTIVLFLALAAIAACAPVTEPNVTLPMDVAEAPMASAVYRQVSPSIAFIETPAGTGSGLLTTIAGQDYVVTNAHVVWPFAQTRVVFPDGSEFRNLPVVQADELTDLAVLGPVDTTIPTLSLRAQLQLQPGDRVYLVGYPGEGELFPVPSISEGILSRIRVWDTLDSLHFYQTDAAGAGGQSGGVLVNTHGEIIGISGLLFAEEFVLAASGVDLADTLHRMVANKEADRRQLLTDDQGTPRRRHVAELRNLWDTDGYLLDAPLTVDVKVRATSDADLGLLLYDSYPEEIGFSDSTYAGSEVITATATNTGPQFVVVEQYGPGVSQYTLAGSHRLTAIRDLDDGLPLTVGSVYTGTIDYPADIDWFVIPLARGEEISVAAEAAMIDPVLAVGPLGAGSDAYLEDDDSGRGMLGSNAALEFRAYSPGDYLIVVRSYAGTDIGGYLLSVSAPNEQD